MTAPARRALITGGSRGIGRSIAAALEASGVDVVAPTREALDLASAASIEAYLASIVDLRIDILVNNAGNQRDRADRRRERGADGGDAAGQPGRGLPPHPGDRSEDGPGVAAAIS